MSNVTPLVLLRFQYHIPDSTVNLEEYLGSNWKTVLNFWAYCETLTNGQWQNIAGKFTDAIKDVAFNNLIHLEANRLWESCEHFNPNKLWYIPGDAIFEWEYDIVDWESDAFNIIGNATLELIEMTENKTLIFVPFFDNP